MTINDDIVRAKSWYATIAGSTPASGATQGFADFYYPAQINDTPIARRVDNSATGTEGGLAGLADIAAAVTAGSTGEASSGTPVSGHYSVTVEPTATDTFIKIRSQSGTKNVYDQAGSSVGTAAMEYLWKSLGFPITGAALLTTQTYTFSGGSDPGFPSGWSFSSNFNAAPEVGTHMSTNSASSFVSTSTSTEYGRKMLMTTTTDGTNNAIGTQIRTTRFDWVLRRAPSSLGASIDKNFYMSFLIHHATVVSED